MLNQASQSNHFIRSFDQLRLADDAPVIVAISGGSDSTALLVGFQEYLTQTQVHPEIVAVTVDHGLRANSALEAEQVGALCDTLNIRHVAKKWRSPEQTSGVQAAARDARYCLIGEVAHDMGAQFVLTGHTLDDQLETIAMRSARREGRGLAGISSATLYNRSTWFVRPLLDASRVELRSYLSDCGMRWMDDPSNDNRHFERVRVRHGAFTSSERYQILGVQAAAQKARENEAQAGSQLILDERNFDFDANKNSGVLSLASIQDEGFEAAVQTIMSKIGRRSHFASSNTMKQILDFAGSGKNGEKFTAQGCLLTINDGRLVVCLEERAKPDGAYCFDHLLPNTDFALANALELRVNHSNLPLAPIKDATR